MKTLTLMLKKNALTITFLLGLYLVAIIIYTLNLKELSWFEGDSARDTLRSLQVLRSKEITTIGPPLSFGQYGIREIYFGSLVYYLGALGLWLFREDVLGPIYVLLGMFAASIPFFYVLTGTFTKRSVIRLLITSCYALGPISVVHSRFFWNPNFIVPLSVVFWLCFLKSLQQLNRPRMAYVLISVSGFLAALMINLHYSVAVLVVVILLYLFVKRKYRMAASFVIGVIAGLSPLLIFELRNKFYLSQAIFYNIMHPVSYPTDRPLITRLLDVGIVTPVIFGLHQDYPFDISILQFPLFVKWLLSLMLCYMGLRVLRRGPRMQSSLTSIAIFTSVLASLLFSRDIFMFRYLFAIYPVFLIIIIDAIVSFIDTSKWYVVVATILIIFVVLLSTAKIITQPTIVSQSLYRMPSINELEHIANIIAHDDPHEKFNITENITGDSRMLYLRYFVFRDHKNEAFGGPTEYMGLKTLYVLTPSLEKTQKENRWEFRTTENLRLSKEWNVREYKLLRFDAMEGADGVEL